MSREYISFEVTVFIRGWRDFRYFVKSHFTFELAVFISGAIWEFMNAATIGKIQLLISSITAGFATLAILLAAAFIFYLLRAPYLLWADQRCRIEELTPDLSKSSNRISLTSFLSYAGQHGWDVEGNNTDVNDFLDGLRQAGLDGTITFYGRPRQLSKDLSFMEPLSQIAADYWRDGDFDLVSCFDWGRGMISKSVARDNIDTFAYIKHGENKGYVDIYVDKSAANDWLRNEATNYKGRNSKREHS